jgi:hypothetical protein
VSARRVTCASCGQWRRYHSNGWCKCCWRRWVDAGRPASGPPPSPYRRWPEYAELTRDMGHTLRQAAERMGISERTAWRYEAHITTEQTTDVKGIAS